MKGAALGWGMILSLLILTSFAIIQIVDTGSISRTVVTRTGGMITLVNEAEMTSRLFDVSLEKLAQRKAFELGNRNEQWTTIYPTLTDFKSKLLGSVTESLPKEDIENSKTYVWTADELDLQECQPLGSSNCFSLTGRKEFIVSDDRFDTTLAINKTISRTVSSSIFKIFSIGRKIIEESQYNSLSNNPQALDSKLEQDFSDFEFEVSVSEGFTNVVIEDRSCNLITDFSCLAPLKSDEQKININGNLIPYDYLKIKFRVSL